MAGKLQFTLEDYQKAAIKYRKQLLMLPIIGAQETLKYMTGRPGIRYKETVAFVNGNAQFAPYKPARRTDYNLNLDFRTLETYFGSLVAQFEPNSAISTLLGTGATKGDGQMHTPTALEVLASIAKQASENLNNAIWNGVRSANGDTTHELFNGFDTITQNEITAGKIAASEGNYMKLTSNISNTNACDIAKDILFSLDPRLRSQDLLMFCSQEFADKYNEAYLDTHSGIVYNSQYEQPYVEGSNKRLTLVPLFNKANSKFIHITPKSNMLVGYDQMSDAESIMVKEYDPFILSYIATMFFGVQFESIDKRRMKVVELSDADIARVTGSNSSSSDSGTSGSGSSSSGTGTTTTTTYSINLTSNSAEGGSVGSGQATATAGSTVRITAVANDGYIFTGWSDGNTSEVRDIVVNSDINLTATFTKAYTLTLVCSPAEAGTVEGGRSGIPAGSSLNICATPNTGYMFSKWSDNNQSAERIVTINSNLTLTAYFIAYTGPEE